MLLIKSEANQEMRPHEHAEVNGAGGMNQRNANKCEHEASGVMLAASRGWS